MEMPARVTVLNLLAICFAGGLLVVVLVDLVRPQEADAEPASEDVPKLQGNWFSPRSFALLGRGQSRLAGIDVEQNPFVDPVAVAKAMEPAAAPVVAAKPEPVAPPPPVTRKISLVYRGFYRSRSGAAFVYIEVDNVTGLYPVGTELVANWTIAAVQGNELILEQDAAPRRAFPFNQKKSLEVPLK